MSVDLSEECVALLHRVVNEVQLSFAAAAQPAAPTAPASPADSPRSSMSSDRSSYSTSSPRSTSSLLYSILQPLLPAAPPPAHVAAHMQPARAHRRQARSLLVDAYRRYVLPSLKERLPSAYLLWAIQSETATKTDEYNGLRDDINRALTAAGVDISAAQEDVPLRRWKSPASGASSPTSYSPTSSRASSPRSSIDSESVLGAIPPAHALPVKQRVAYSAQLNRITQLSSRIGAITKLASRYEREEGKRKWLEQLDLNRDGDKALRRAFSNGLLPASATLSATPIRRSGLRSVVSADNSTCAAVSATAALEDILEAVSDEDDMSEPDLSDSRSSLSASPEPFPPTPISDRTSAFGDFEDIPLNSKDAPGLVPSRSDDSLSERDDWDADIETLTDAEPTPGTVWEGKKIPLPPLPSQSGWDHVF